MRAAVAAVAAGGGLLMPGFYGAPPTPVPVGPPVVSPESSLVAAASPARAGARPTRLVLRLRTELQCGSPGAGPIVVRLPSAERVPHEIGRSSVRVDGRMPLAVTVKGRVVTLGLRRPAGVLCDSIGPGTVVVVFQRAARLGNPVKAGRYSIRIGTGARRAIGHLTVERAAP